MSAALQSMRALLSRRCLATPVARCARSHSFIQSSARSYSTLPVIDTYVPRTYPFDIVLTTELIPEEDLQWRPVNPHDLPRYKSTLRVNIWDLPLSEDERHVFRMLVGERVFSQHVQDHPIPVWLNPTKRQRQLKTARRQASKPNEVKFSSSNLPSARANENRVFQQLDECIRQSKLLVKEFQNDGEYIEAGEDEMILRRAKRQYQMAMKASQLSEKSAEQ